MTTQKGLLKARHKIAEIVLSHWCPACHGEGKVELTEAESTPCGECEGYGMLITDEGSTVLSFIHEFTKRSKI